VVTAILACLPLHSQELALDWFSLSAAAPAARSERFSLRGAFGLPYPSPAAGGALSLTTGWFQPERLLAAPALSVEVAGGGTILIGWAAVSERLLLEESDGLGRSDWKLADATLTVTEEGTRAVVAATGTARFFRLRLKALGER
jgi:hypothetical protein